MADGTIVVEPAAEPSGMAALFDRAKGDSSGLPQGAPAPANEAAPSAATVSQVAAAPVVPAAAPAATPTAPAFVPPASLIGEPAVVGQQVVGQQAVDTTASTAPTVAELMPETPPEGIKSEKGKADYKKWREHQLALEKDAKRTKELEGQIAQLRANPQQGAEATARIQQLEQRLVQMSAVVEKYGIQEHPAFQEQFVRPQLQAAEDARNIVEMAGLEKNAIDSVLRLQGKARVEALDELMESITSPTLKGQLAENLFRYEQIDKQKAAVEKDRSGWLQNEDLRIKANQHAQIQETEKQFNALLDESVGFLRDKAGFEMLKEDPGNEQWNGRVQQRVKEAQYLLTRNTDPKQLAAAAVLAVVAPEYRQWALNAEQRARTAERELAELKGATPRLNGGSGGGQGGGGEERSGLASLFDRAKANTVSVR